MNAKPTFGEPHPLRAVVAAASATVIALGILWSVVTLFRSRGEPLERLAAAERACANRTYQSEREACMKEWIAASESAKVAHR